MFRKSRRRVVLADKLAGAPTYAVIGIYAGEHTYGGALVHDRDESGALIYRDGVPQGEKRVGGITVGVVASAADFGTWCPELLRHSLIHESNPTPEEAAAAGLPPTV